MLKSPWKETLRALKAQTNHPATNTLITYADEHLEVLQSKNRIDRKVNQLEIPNQFFDALSEIETLSHFAKAYQHLDIAVPVDPSRDTDQEGKILDKNEEIFIEVTRRNQSQNYQDALIRPGEPVTAAVKIKPLVKNKLAAKLRELQDEPWDQNQGFLLVANLAGDPFANRLSRIISDLHGQPSVTYLLQKDTYRQSRQPNGIYHEFSTLLREHSYGIILYERKNTDLRVKYKWINLAKSPRKLTNTVRDFGQRVVKTNVGDNYVNYVYLPN